MSTKKRHDKNVLEMCFTTKKTVPYKYKLLDVTINISHQAIN